MRHLSIYFTVLFLMLSLAMACKNSGTNPDPDFFQLLKVTSGDVTLSASSQNDGISPKVPFSIYFTAAVDTNSILQGITLSAAGNPVELSVNFEDANTTVHLTPVNELSYTTQYELTLSQTITSAQGAVFPGISYQLVTENGTLGMTMASINGDEFSAGDTPVDIAYNLVQIRLEFSEELDASTYQDYIRLSPQVTLNYALEDHGKTVVIAPVEPLDYYAFYSVNVSSSLTSKNGFEFDGYTGAFQTGVNPTYKFPEISDDELLTTVQRATFNYFWEFGHPVSGLARERNSSGDVVTTGGSGFGLMALLVGIERGFITREEGVTRLQKIVQFLANNADRFHGAWSHWLNGSTGDAIAFSTKDNGADLVETAFLAQGLIAVRQYLDEGSEVETVMIETINTMLDDIEWNWFTQGGQDVLYWHWSPNYGWDMNMQIKGYNEALIVYVLAATSKNYSIDADAYHQGWASSGGILNGNQYYGHTLPVGYGFGGPLFFAHYSFLGLDPRNLADTYANYWTQNRNHTLIHQAYSQANPKNFIGYTAESWGLTASDQPGGYSAHEPNNDNGTITPTAAVSSLPYAPEESMAAIRHFYYVLGDKLWGEYGFYDAFNPSQSWWATSYLAIDQGPIVVMIENYRSGMIWDLFMSAPEVNTALDKLGFTLSE